MQKANSIIVLLGAGASVDAGLPTSKQILEQIEELINDKDNREWYPFQELFNYIKSAILYANGILGDFSGNINIEHLVGVLRDLYKKERNPIFPFIGAWNNKLVEIAGDKFERIDILEKMLSKEIVKQVTIKNNTKERVSYFENLYQYQKETVYPLRVFTLNYDLCIEKAKKDEDIILELGFNENNEWDATRFNNSDIEANLYLYKLHGSIDWYRNKNKGLLLEKMDVPMDGPELIFGTDAKIRSIDPFLFNIYELRRLSLECNLLVVIGYSFNDEHINDLLGQALVNNKTRRLIIVDPTLRTDLKIHRKLNCNEKQVIIKSITAKDFLFNEFKPDILERYFDNSENVF